MSEIPPASVVHGSVTAVPPAGPMPDGYQPLFDLVSPTAITAATFLTGPLSGVWLLARNFRRLGRPEAAWWTIGLGLVAVAAVFTLAVLLPENFPSFMISAPLVLGAWQAARITQGAAFEAHVARGGPQIGRGKLVAIALAALVIQAAVIVGVVFATTSAPAEHPRVDLGSGHEVYYYDGATEADARAVGAVLDGMEYFQPTRPASVAVTRPGDNVVVGLVVGDSAVDKSFNAAFADIARHLSADAFAGAPVDLWLLDGELHVRSKRPWVDAP